MRASFIMDSVAGNPRRHDALQSQRSRPEKVHGYCRAGDQLAFRASVDGFLANGRHSRLEPPGPASRRVLHRRSRGLNG